MLADQPLKIDNCGPLVRGFPRMRPNRRIVGAAHSEVLDVLAVGPVRGEFSHKTRTQVLIEEQFHAAV